MIDVICDSVEDALKVRNILDKENCILHSESVNYFRGEVNLAYLYSDMGVMQNHINYMIEEGYLLVDKCYNLWLLDYTGDPDLTVCVARFRKKISSISNK